VLLNNAENVLEKMTRNLQTVKSSAVLYRTAYKPPHRKTITRLKNPN